VRSPILAFRPASVVRRLAQRNEACPLSLRDVLAAVAPLPICLPLVRAPSPGVARAALVAAKELGSALGLALPAGARPEPWFEALARAADEIAPRLPIFLSGEVVLQGGSDGEVEVARREAWRLVEGGITHLAFDLGGLPEADRAPALRRAAEAALERAICVDCLVPLQGGLPSAPRAAALLEELAEMGVKPDLASARLPLPRDPEEERSQARLLVEICGWIDGTPLLRRGPVTTGLLATLAGSPLRVCEDGGAALVAAARALGREPDADAGPPLAVASRELPPEIGDRPEAMAYAETAAFLEALAAEGSAVEVAEALVAGLEEG
jgi:hypothetical protein